MNTPETHPHFMEGIPNWPIRVGLMQTSGGMHISRFQPCDEIDQTFRIDIREERTHPLTGKVELGHYNTSFMNGQMVYFPREFFEPMRKAQQRAIQCLQGKGGENFAE